jgi:mannitol-specific phosphotransferase system IIBC component
MKQTMMAYMVATIVSFAVVGGLIMQPISSMAQGQQQEEDVNQSQGQQQENQVQTQDQRDTRSSISNAACGQVVEVQVLTVQK